MLCHGHCRRAWWRRGGFPRREWRRRWPLALLHSRRRRARRHRPARVLRRGPNGLISALAQDEPVRRRAHHVPHGRRVVDGVSSDGGGVQHSFVADSCSLCARQLRLRGGLPNLLPHRSHSSFGRFGRHGVHLRNRRHCLRTRFLSLLLSSLLRFRRRRKTSHHLRGLLLRRFHRSFLHLPASNKAPLGQKGRCISG